MNYIYSLLAYLRIASYAIVFISSVFSLKYGVKSVKRVFYGNLVFTFLASLSVFHYAILGKNLELMVAILITLGATAWAILCFGNYTKV